jgi:hypothetical protein
MKRSLLVNPPPGPSEEGSRDATPARKAARIRDTVLPAT